MRGTSRILLGLLLIGSGVIFALNNLGILTFGNQVWGVLFGVAGLIFLGLLVANRRRWWPAIPGFVFLGLSVLILSAELVPAFADTWGGAIFLGAIGLGFWTIYLLVRENWWAIIPGGVLLTLAIVAGVSEYAAGWETGGIFFLGLGSTFLIVALVPTVQGRMRWAFFPAGALLLIGFLIIASLNAWINLVWPSALILLGLFLVYRSLIVNRV